PTPAASPDPTAGLDEIAGEWIAVPPSPLGRRVGSVSAWIGDSLLRWGGQVWKDGGTFLPAVKSDGAIYRPTEGEWREIAPSPLPARQRPIAVWTGEKALVWGGEADGAPYNDGAAYDPAIDRWRPMAPSPLAPRIGPAAVWTGRELLILGGFDLAGPRSDAAAYDPAQDAWRQIAPAPDGLLQAAWDLGAEWANGAVLVWVAGKSDLAPGALYDTDADSWRLLPGIGSASFLHRIVPVPGGLLAVTLDRGGRLHLLELADGESHWAPVSIAPLSSAWRISVEWTDVGLVVVNNSATHWLYEPGADQWLRLPDGPAFDAWWQDTLWTGRELIISGRSPNNAPPRREAPDWAFRFAPNLDSGALSRRPWRDSPLAAATPRPG
ncbi:MAG TPA: hypothetical protein VML96_08165, partial [Egibacteraceae bacterium]|nr:hypothetical protein [Egibacteraceae bacterium]